MEAFIISLALVASAVLVGVVLATPETDQPIETRAGVFIEQGDQGFVRPDGTYEITNPNETIKGCLSGSPCDM